MSNTSGHLTKSYQKKECKMADNVNPIPEGYHSLTPHLVVDNASRAIDFYKDAFDAKELVRMPTPDGKSILHAEIQIGDSIIMLNDEFPDMGVKAPSDGNGSPVTIHIYVENVDSVFDRAIASGAKEVMVLQDKFWGDRYGMLVDPFGHSWSLATHIEDVEPEEMKKRAEEAMKEFDCHEG
jgi:PhnB protein